MSEKVNNGRAGYRGSEFGAGAACGANRTLLCRSSTFL